MTTPTLKADTVAAAQDLAASLSTATGQAADDLKGYAEQYGPMYAEAATALAAAKLAGDAAATIRAQAEIDVLTDEAVEAAALAGINVEVAAETTLEKVLTGFVTLLVSRLIPA